MWKFHALANPSRFVALTRAVLPFCALAAVLAIGAGLYGGLVMAPADYLQGDAARIMYVHVPAAWMALFGYSWLALCSACYLIWKHPVADAMARGCSLSGACFTAVALITGMLWGKPSWGTAWVWDARLTSVLILQFLFLAHMVFIRSFDDAEKAARYAAILALVGFVNIPIIKFSVEWWNTLHQPASISQLGAPHIHSSMLWPLLAMAVGFLALQIMAVLMGARAELAALRLRLALEREAANG